MEIRVVELVLSENEIETVTDGWQVVQILHSEQKHDLWYLTVLQQRAHHTLRKKLQE